MDISVATHSHAKVEGMGLKGIWRKMDAWCGIEREVGRKQMMNWLMQENGFGDSGYDRFDGCEWKTHEGITSGGMNDEFMWRRVWGG